MYQGEDRESGAVYRGRTFRRMVRGALLVALLVFSSCSGTRNADPASAKADPSTAPSPAIVAPPAAIAESANPALDAVNATVAQITANTDSYIGQYVIVRDEIDALINDHVFALDEDAPHAAGIDNDLLVITADSTPVIASDASVEVIGQVQPFDMARIEQEAGLELDDRVLTDYADRPVLIAMLIRPLPEYTSPDIPPVNAGRTEQNDAVIAAGEIIGNANAFLDKRVLVGGEIGNMISPAAFVFDADAMPDGSTSPGLLVVSANGLPLIEENSERAGVRVSGIVRIFDAADLERAYGIDLFDDGMEEFGGRPVVVATSAEVVSLKRSEYSMREGPSRFPHPEGTNASTDYHRRRR